MFHSLGSLGRVRKRHSQPEAWRVVFSDAGCQGRVRCIMRCPSPGDMQSQLRKTNRPAEWLNPESDKSGWKEIHFLSFRVHDWKYVVISASIKVKFFILKDTWHLFGNSMHFPAQLLLKTLVVNQEKRCGYHLGVKCECGPQVYWFRLCDLISDGISHYGSLGG